MPDHLPQDEARHLHSLVDTALRDLKSGDQARLFAAGLAAVVQQVAKLTGPGVKRLAGRPATSPGLLLAGLADAALAGEAKQRSLTPDEKLARAHLKGVVVLRQLLADHGGSYTPGEVAELLGVTRQAVNKRTRANQLLAVAQGDHVVYPVWQFQGTGLVPHFVAVLQALETGSAIAKVRFFLAPHEALDGRSPLAALKAGDSGAVIDLARRFGQHGA